MMAWPPETNMHGLSEQSGDLYTTYLLCSQNSFENGSTERPRTHTGRLRAEGGRDLINLKREGLLQKIYSCRLDGKSRPLHQSRAVMFRLNLLDARKP